MPAASSLIYPHATFGRWTVLSRSKSDVGLGAYWLCRCTCGTTAAVRARSLRNGRSTGCGRTCLDYVDPRTTARISLAELAAAPAPPQDVQPPQTAALVCEQPVGGRPTPTPRPYATAPAVQWFDQGERPRCVWCGEPSLPNSAKCRTHAGPRFVHTAPDARHA